jgi:hypothetical protein
MLVTTGRILSPAELAEVTEQLEAKAKLAESKGLPETARSWRSQIANLQNRTITIVRSRLKRQQNGG